MYGLERRIERPGWMEDASGPERWKSALLGKTAMSRAIGRVMRCLATRAALAGARRIVSSGRRSRGRYPETVR